MWFEFHFSITLFKYNFQASWEPYNGVNNGIKGNSPIKKPYIFKVKETELSAAKYYGGWWSWSWNWLYFEFQITELV